MASPYILYKLPAALQVYDVREASATPPGSQECLICYRTFGDTDDLVDSDDAIACRPFALQPCKHIVGSECFKKLIQLGDTCPLCRTKISVASERVPSLLRWLASTTWYKFQVDLARHPQAGVNNIDYFDQLSQQLFLSDLRPSEAVKLWWFYVEVSLYCTSALAVLAINVWAIFFSLTLVYGKAFAELNVLRLLVHDLPDSESLAIGFDIASIWALLLATERRLRYTGHVSHLSCIGFVCFALRVTTLLFGLRNVLVVLLINFAICTLLTGLLVKCGIGK